MDQNLQDYINSLLEEEEKRQLRKFVDEITPMVLRANKGVESAKPQTLYFENSYKQPSIYTSPNAPELKTSPDNLRTNKLLLGLKNTLHNIANAVFNQPKMPNNTSTHTDSKTEPINQMAFNLAPIKNSNTGNLNSGITMPKTEINNNQKQKLTGFNQQPIQSANVSNTNTFSTLKQKSLENPTTSDSPNWIMPCEGRISSEYGWRIHPIYKTRKWHNGIDIAVDEGTPIKAIADGTICAVGAAKGYGYWVAIDHGAINGVQVTSEYGHISRWCVTYGQKVKQGQIIAYSGNTGDSQGPHCHLTIRNGEFQGIPVNPWNYINH